MGTVAPPAPPQAKPPAKHKRKHTVIKPVARTGELTAYVADCSTGCTGVTATGVNVRNRTTYDGLAIVAVDPARVPLWSVLRIRFASGRTVKAIALDTGAAISGNDIDLLVGSRRRALEIGRQTVSIEILRKGDD